jgi:hypothetical protein
MKIDGRCHCGTIRYEAEVDPAKVVICHCRDCQTLSGSAFRTVVPTNEGTFRLLSGAPKVYVKTGDSGNRREPTFCPDCGTPIYSATVGRRQDCRPACRHVVSARSTDPERPILVPLVAGMASAHADDEQARNTARLRFKGRLWRPLAGSQLRGLQPALRPRAAGETTCSFAGRRWAIWPHFFVMRSP